jgi:hypothetical protein
LTSAPRFSDESKLLLADYAEKYFALHVKKEDGTSEADSLIRAIEALSRRADKGSIARREELEAKLQIPDFPEEYTHAWAAYRDLAAQRGSNGFGPSPISYSEMEAYCRLTGRVLYSYEVDGITIIDGAYLMAQSNAAKASKAAQKSANLPKQPSASAPPRKVPNRR